MSWMLRTVTIELLLLFVWCVWIATIRTVLCHCVTHFLQHSKTIRMLSKLFSADCRFPLQSHSQLLPLESLQHGREIGHLNRDKRNDSILFVSEGGIQTNGKERAGSRLRKRPNTPRTHHTEMYNTPFTVITVSRARLSICIREGCILARLKTRFASS